MSDKKNGIVGGILLVSGIVVGVATTLLIKESRPMKASVVLNQVKKAYSNEGKIEGSWIDYDSIEYDRFEDKPLVYIGGITRIENDARVQYQFVADVYTGDVIEAQRVKTERVL